MIIFKHVVGQPRFFAPAAFLQNFIAILAIPLWLCFAAAFGKHRAALRLWNYPITRAAQQALRGEIDRRKTALG